VTKLMNSPDCLAVDMLEVLCPAHPLLVHDVADGRVIRPRHAPRRIGVDVPGMPAFSRLLDDIAGDQQPCPVATE
jgi:hypothetical protein